MSRDANYGLRCLRVERLDELVALSARIGDPREDLVILAEGNTSTRRDADAFFIKASGRSLVNSTPDAFVAVRFPPILAALQSMATDQEVREILAEARVSAEGNVMPSVETFMHADLLSLPDVEWVIHTHPTSLISLLSRSDAERLSRLRLFPDEIVCCGPATPFVPYQDPGLPLAVEIRRAVRAYIEEFGGFPRTIWLQNHGLITLGRTAKEAESATFMAAKAARVWIGLMAAGATMHPMSKADIERIQSRPDEHYRQRLLFSATPENDWIPRPS